MQTLNTSTTRCEWCGKFCGKEKIELDNSDEYDRDQMQYGEGHYWTKTIIAFVCRCGWMQDIS